MPIVGAIGLTSLILIFAVVLLLFGSTLIPRLFRSIGQIRGEFRRGRREEDKRGED